MTNRHQTAEQKGCSKAIGCLFMLPFLVAGGVFLLMSLPPSTNKPDTSTSQPTDLPPAYTSAPPTPTGNPPPNTSAPVHPQAGTSTTSARLDYNGQPVLVATTEYVASQIVNDIAASNTEALSKLEKSGEAYIVDDDTPVIVVNRDHYLTGASVYHVRIKGGAYNGKDGWVPSDYVHQ